MKTIEKALRAALPPLLILVMLANLASCGTLLHPERKGQRGGQLDAGIVVLDAVGLLFFLIPGVIAFAVDFSNGTIYLPHGRRASSDDPSHTYAQIRLNGKPGLTEIENAVRAETGKTIDMRQPNVQIMQLDSAADLDAAFARYGAARHSAEDRIASAQ